MTDGADSKPDDDDAGPRDTMRGRLDQSRVKTWFLMNGNRWLVTGLVAATFFAALVLSNRLGSVPIRSLIANNNVLWWVFSPMIGAIVTGVTLVITISQLILSQELGALGDQRERMEGAMEFRTDVESWLDEPVSPADPASFLEVLIDDIQSRANDLSDAVADSPDRDCRELIDDYVETLDENAKGVRSGLEGAQFGGFDVVFSALNFNYSWKIHQGRRILERHEESLDEDATRALEDLVQLLRFFGPAREHIKTLYFQWELVNLSRIMLVAAVPALFVAVGVQLYVSSSTFPGTFIGVENIVWFLTACVTLTLLPFFVLLSYILRITTVTKRTLSIGPFILRDVERTDDTADD